MDAKILDRLTQIDACEEALTWVTTQPDLDTAWRECRRSDWMLWLLGQSTNVGAREIVHLGCDLAGGVLKFVPDGEERPAKAIEAARRWARGETISTVDLYAAAHAAYDAYDTVRTARINRTRAAVYAAAYAAHAAAYAADDSTAYVDVVRDAADATAYAGAANAAQCDLIRVRFPKPPEF